jgi:two-component system, LuxR family, response regulator FixJ
MQHEMPIYIIDDEPEMCRSLSLLLATSGVPARSFGSADLFLDTLDALPIGIIICDVIMPGSSGIALVRALPQRDRPDPVIVIAGHADVPLAVDALKAGAYDFIEKPFEASVIGAAVAGARALLQDRIADRNRLEVLSPRERQVLHLITQGATSKEAARALGISPRTVETYRVHLLEKTGAATTAELIRIGVELARSGNGSLSPLVGHQLDTQAVH